MKRIILFTLALSLASFGQETRRNSGGVQNIDCTGTGHILKIINGVGNCTADGAGGSTTFQQNGSNLTSATTVNYLNGTHITITNPSAGNVSFAVSGLTLADIAAGVAGSGTYDFTGATILKLRASAGLTSSVNGDFGGFDTTNGNYHAWNGADKIIALLSGAFTDGNCLKISNVSSKLMVLDAGAPCGSGGGGSGTVTNVAITVPSTLLTVTGTPVTTSGTFAVSLINNAGANTVFGNNTGSPATPAFGFLNTAQAGSNVQGNGLKYQLSTGSTTDGNLVSYSNGNTVDSTVPTPTISSPQVGQVMGVTGTSPLVWGNVWIGVCDNPQTTGTYIAVAADRGCLIRLNNGAGTFAVTLPQAGSAGFGSNFDFYVRNEGTGVATITPTTSTINGAASLAIPGGWSALITSENSGNTYKALRIPGDASTTFTGLVQLAGDLAGTATAPTVAKMNGVSYPASPAVDQIPLITSAASGGAATYKTIPPCPDSTGNHLNYSGSAFSCGTTSSGGGGGSGSGGAGGFGQAFTTQTTVTIAGTSHLLHTKYIVPSCFDTASPANLIIPNSVTVDGTSFDVVIKFLNSQSGYCVVVAGAGKYAATFTSQTTVTVTGATHGLGTADLNVTILDSATGARRIIKPDSVSVDSTTFDVTVVFLTSQSGRIVIQ